MQWRASNNYPQLTRTNKMLQRDGYTTVGRTLHEYKQALRPENNIIGTTASKGRSLVGSKTTACWEQLPSFLGLYGHSEQPWSR